MVDVHNSCSTGQRLKPALSGLFLSRLKPRPTIPNCEIASSIGGPDSGPGEYSQRVDPSEEFLVSFETLA